MPAGNESVIQATKGGVPTTLICDADGRLEASGSRSTSWTQNHQPAVNTIATKSQAAGAGTVKNVCTSITCTLSNDGTGTAAPNVVFILRDGATGAGNVLWTGALSLTATAGDSKTLAISGLHIVGTAATAMTLETVALGGTVATAPGAHTAASVAMTGYTQSA